MKNTILYTILTPFLLCAQPTTEPSAPPPTTPPTTPSVWVVFYQEQDSAGNWADKFSPVFDNEQSFLDYVELVENDASKELYYAYGGDWHPYKQINEPAWTLTGDGTFKYLITYTENASNGTTITQTVSVNQSEALLLKNNPAVTIVGNKPFWGERLSAVKEVSDGPAKIRFVISN